MLKCVKYSIIKWVVKMRIIVSAGGTGGHIYPALSIINKFKEKDSHLEVLYIGTHNRMEKDIVPQNNIKYEALEIYGFSKTNIKRDLKNINLIIKARKKCLKIMQEFKPDLVIGTGGYVTYPVISAANKLGIKTFIHEQNSIPGKSNLALAKKCSLVGVSFKESLKYFKNCSNVFYSGNPCGENALTIKKADKTKLGFHKNKKLVICVCGSLGSSSINNKLKDYLINFDDDYEVLYITGKNLYANFAPNVTFPSNVKVVPYFDNLSALMKSADLIVTRAGASTISELLALQIPAIFIPSPYVANNHQYYNAKTLEDNQAGLMIEEKDLTSDLLKTKINELISNPTNLAVMKDNMQKLAVTNSSEIIYNKLVEK